MFDQFRLRSLPNNEALLYHESQVFPPGYGTLEIAKEASSKVNQIRKNFNNPNSQVNILDLGTGPGTFLAAILSDFQNETNLYLYGLEKDEMSSGFAEYNLKRIAKKRNISTNIQITRGDWTDDGIWEAYKLNPPMNIIYFNPPYYDSESNTSNKLMHVPEEMKIASPDDKFFHYRYVLPRIPKIFSSEKGSSILLRLPPDEDICEPPFQDILSSMIQNMPKNTVLHEQLVSSQTSTYRYYVCEVIA